MTDEQMEKVRVFMKQYIASWQEHVRLKLGEGIHGYQSGPDQVLFLDSGDPPPADDLDERRMWSVAFYGYDVSNTQGAYTPADSDQGSSWNTTTTSGYGVLLTASSRGLGSSLLENRVATFQQIEPPAQGYNQFSQTLFISIPTFQFPVGLVFQVQIFDATGELISTDIDTLNFFTGNEQEYPIIQELPGRKLVTAIDVIRL